MNLWLAERQKLHEFFIYMLFLNVKLMLMSYKCTLLLRDKDQVFRKQRNKFSLQRLRKGYEPQGSVCSCELPNSEKDTMSMYIA